MRLHSLFIPLCISICMNNLKTFTYLFIYLVNFFFCTFMLFCSLTCGIYFIHTFSGVVDTKTRSAYFNNWYSSLHIRSKVSGKKDLPIFNFLFSFCFCSVISLFLQCVRFGAFNDLLLEIKSLKELRNKKIK